MSDRQLAVRKVHLPKRNEASLIEELRVTDLLFVNSMVQYAEGVKKAFEARGIRVENLGRVQSELYPVGDGTYGETFPGSNIFKIGSMGDLGEYKFTGDELDPANALVITSAAVRYGREFNQICEVLERYKRRNLSAGAIPPTFAFFRHVYCEEIGSEIDLNNLIRVQRTVLGEYLRLF